ARAFALGGGGSTLKRLDCSGKLVEDELMQVDSRAGVVDINAHQHAVGIEIQENAFGDLAALDARPFDEIDVKRVCFGMVVELHGRNRLSKNALWIVSPSASVTTRR